METVENNSASSTHQEKAKKLRKLRRWQVVISLLGIGVMIWGVIQVVCLFLDYKQTETLRNQQRCPNRTVYISCQPACLGLYQEDLFYRTPGSSQGRHLACIGRP